MFARGECGPDFQPIPRVPGQGESHFLKVPAGNAPALAATRINRVDGAHEFLFLSIEMAPGCYREPPRQLTAGLRFRPGPEHALARSPAWQAGAQIPHGGG